MSLLPYAPSKSVKMCCLTCCVRIRKLSSKEFSHSIPSHSTFSTHTTNLYFLIMSSPGRSPLPVSPESSPQKKQQRISPFFPKSVIMVPDHLREKLVQRFQRAVAATEQSEAGQSSSRSQSQGQVETQSPDSSTEQPPWGLESYRSSACNLAPNQGIAVGKEWTLFSNPSMTSGGQSSRLIPIQDPNYLTVPNQGHWKPKSRSFTQTPIQNSLTLYGSCSDLHAASKGSIDLRSDHSAPNQSQEVAIFKIPSHTSMSQAQPKVNWKTKVPKGQKPRSNLEDRPASVPPTLYPQAVNCGECGRPINDCIRLAADSSNTGYFCKGAGNGKFDCLACQAVFYHQTLLESHYHYVHLMKLVDKPVRVKDQDHRLWKESQV